MVNKQKFSSVFSKSDFETDYKTVIQNILNKGERIPTRTGVDAITLFNETINVDLSKGFPIITGKEIFFNKAYHEYRWMRDGLTTTKYLNDHGITWWNEFANAKGELGKTYGYQLRNHNGKVDQLMDVADLIRYKSRRAYITMWNPSDLEEQALPCCFTSFNFVVIGDVLNMSMEFRSSDVFLGLPYDIVVGALMLYDMAWFTDLKVGKLGLNLTNAHIYVNHLNAVDTYFSQDTFELPKYNMKFKSVDNMLKNYSHSKFVYANLNK